ncbi:MAG: rRNA maturation RNase YbeY [Bacilli bacterium]|nr:rRNA maturation RNase YbeY [Bacilli bacterium]
MNEFEIINNTKENIEEINNLNEFIDFALKYLKLKKVIFNIIFVDDTYIHNLNKEYRGIDRPTDVISFALEDDQSFIKTDFKVLGDIYISLDTAKKQAEEYQHSLKREISFLAIHGLLHLLGYDHMKKEDEEKMFALQELILNEAGIKR